MSDFKANVHQIRFPRRGSLQRSPDLLSVFKGPTSKGGRGKEREGVGKGKVRQGKRGEGCLQIGESGSGSGGGGKGEKGEEGSLGWGVQALPFSTLSTG